MKQYVCRAYIMLIYYLEATFDYLIAAQSKEPNNKDIAFLNKRIQWQLDYKLYGLSFKAIDLLAIKLFIFIDESFANKKDQSSQISYVIVFTNKYSHTNINKFIIKDNTIHWSLIKC